MVVWQRWVQFGVLQREPLGPVRLGKLNALLHAMRSPAKPGEAATGVERVRSCR